MSHVRIFQKVKGVLMSSLHNIIYMKTKILADFQICISLLLINLVAVILNIWKTGNQLKIDR